MSLSLVSVWGNRHVAILIACLLRILSLPCRDCGHPSADSLPLCHEGYTYLLCNVVTPVLAASVVLEVACWPLVPKFAGSHTAKAVGFLARKNPQHAFLQRGSKAVGPMS
jgi:hypothetical protein